MQRPTGYGNYIRNTPGGRVSETPVPCKPVTNDYYSAWQKANPGANIPKRLTVKPSDSSWPSFTNTPFFKAANFAFQPNRKTVVSLDLVSLGGLKDVWFPHFAVLSPNLVVYIDRTDSRGLAVCIRTVAQELSWSARVQTSRRRGMI
ncbi:hypothetical protein LX36DRAFT_702488 [Colletotrichum falcatum]|nr:hypothetical protein LX36DRAFT_702488 [Colletotrichum falcatum]